MKDIIIIGGGPAGLTAAIYSARAGKNVLVIEKENCGGQIVYSPLVENYPGLPGISGADFAGNLTAQAEALGVEIEYGEVLEVRKCGDGFEVDFGDILAAKAVILAPGASHRRLGLEKEDELTGCGVSYCAVCDGAFCAGMEVAVNGGGNTALQDALFLSGVCSHVTVIHRRDEFRGDDALVRRLKERANVSFMMSCIVTGLQEKDGELSGITVEDLKTGAKMPLKVSGLFIAVGQIPQTEAFRSLVQTDEAGYFIADEDMSSTTPGIFIAGDCRAKKVRQLTTAAADGAVAALSACSYTDEHEGRDHV